MSSVCVENLCKSYHNHSALNGIGFEVEKGKIFGIIGPDGAGKSILFRILTTLLLADSGSVTIEGLDVVADYKKIRNLIGYMPGKFSLYQDLSVEENLKFFATIFRTTIQENYALIQDIYKQIEPFKTRKAGKLSGGMKQKLALCCALIHKPSVLFLDEPTTGIDPVSRKELWEMLLKLKTQGITILVSTPYMDEASLCDKIALIQNGAFLQIDTPERICASYPMPLWSVQSDQMHSLRHHLRAYLQTRTAFSFGKSYHVTFKEPLLPDQLNQFLTNMGHTGIEISSISPTIEDCFMLLSNNTDHGSGI